MIVKPSCPVSHPHSHFVLHILSDGWKKTLHFQQTARPNFTTRRFSLPLTDAALWSYACLPLPSCDALFGTSGNEVYPLNLEQWRYLKPLVLSAGDGGASSVARANVIDVNAAHGLWAFGSSGTGRSNFGTRDLRAAVVLALPRSQLVPIGWLT